MLQLIPNPSAPAWQRDIFVGRTREQEEFRASVRYLLGHEQPPDGNPLYPHIFLIHGEGGMGKSALLHQCRRIASEEGLPAGQNILIDLEHSFSLTADALVERLAQDIRRQHPRFGASYYRARARRDKLAGRHRDLDRQWKRWEKLRNASDDDYMTLVAAQRRTPPHGNVALPLSGPAGTPSNNAHPPDEYSEYETGLSRLLSRVGRGHSLYSDALILQGRLKENIDRSRRYGSTETHKVDRFQIIDQLNSLTVLALGISFNELCAPPSPVSPTLQMAEVAHGIPAVVAFYEKYGYEPTSFADLLNDEFGASDAALFRPEGEPSVKLAKDLYSLAETTPLLLAIDTHERADEYDKWLCKFICDVKGSRVLIMSAGRRLLTYCWHIDSTCSPPICFYGLNEPLRTAEVQQYLRLHPSTPDDPPDDLVKEVYRISHGIPLALEALGNQLASGDDLAPYRSIDPAKLDRRAVVRTVTKCFLRSVLADPDDDQALRRRKGLDLLRIRALALLLRLDWELVWALLDVVPEEGQKLVSDLADRYSFLFTDYRGYIMQSLVREFIRADTRDGGRQLLEWESLKAGLRRALPIIDERLARAERGYLADPDNRYKDDDWCKATLDRLNALLWLSEDLGEDIAARELLLNRWIEARYVQRSFADQLAALTHEMKSRSESYSWGRVVNALQMPDYDQIWEVVNKYDIKIEPHAHAVFCYLSAQTLPVESVTDDNLKRVNARITLLEQGYTSDTNWEPLRKELADVYSKRGYYYLKQKEDATALKDFDRALKLCPADPIALNHRSVAKRNLNDLEGALNDVKQALALNPRSITAILNHGMTMLLRGDPTSALKDFEQTLAQRPDDPFALNSRGQAKRKLGDMRGAIADHRKVLEKKPDDSEAIYNIACICALRGQLDAMLSLLRRAISLDPSWRKYARSDPSFDTFRAHPRFVELVGQAAGATQVLRG